ncbi:hypothetical protein ACP4OV_003769 [Aristida adscensionis]
MATPSHACLLLRMFVLLLPHCLPHLAAGRPADDDEAQVLLRVKRAWGDPPVLAAWNATAAAAHCAWPYVECDGAGRVTNISISGAAGVAGHFPDDIGNLPSLTHLVLSNNSMIGAFPTTLYRCRSLRYLNLSLNFLGWELPADIGRRLGVNLTALILSGNRFNGTIPTSLSSLRNLRDLFLDSNRLTGVIPPALGELTVETSPSALRVRKEYRPSRIRNEGVLEFVS